MGLFDFLGPVGAAVEGVGQIGADIGGSLWSNQKNVDLYHEQRDYNTPENQMNRFKAAGLNPNLIYGQQNVASPPPTMIAPRTTMPDILGKIQQSTNIGQANAQTSNILAQNDLIKAQAAAAQIDAASKARELKILTDMDQSGYSVSGSDYHWVKPLVQVFNMLKKSPLGQFLGSTYDEGVRNLKTVPNAVRGLFYGN